MCNQAVEDELHFLFLCNLYDTERRNLYSKLPELLNEMDLPKRFELLCTKPHTMGTYIEKLWTKQEGILNYPPV